MLLSTRCGGTWKDNTNNNKNNVTYCVKNWSGSSKGMQAQAAVDIKEIYDKHNATVRVDRVCGTDWNWHLVPEKNATDAKSGSSIEVININYVLIRRIVFSSYYDSSDRHSHTSIPLFLVPSPDDDCALAKIEMWNKVRKVSS